MKVVIITSFPFPDGKATANRVRVFAEELIKKRCAYEVNIVSTTADKSASVAFTDKINILNLNVQIIDKNRLISRSLSELVIAFKLWSIAKKVKADIVIVTIPSPLLLIPMSIFPKPIKLILDVRDAVWTYFPKSTLGGLPGILLRILFRMAAQKADLVSVTNSYEAKSVKAISGVEAIVVANGISDANLKSLQSIELKSIQGKVNMTYIGNVGIAQELEILTEFSKFYQKDTEINIVGDGARLPNLKSKAINENVSNITFHGEVPADIVRHHLEASDVLFAQIGHSFQLAIPTKVFEYIAAGRKILLGLPEGPAKEVFRDFYGVEIFPVGNVECMKQSYEQLILQEFGGKERKLNLDLLNSKYIRENGLTTLLSKLNNM